LKSEKDKGIGNKLFGNVVEELNCAVAVLELNVGIGARWG